MRKIIWPGIVLAVAAAGVTVQGCPRPTPTPLVPEVGDATLETAAVTDAAPPPAVDAARRQVEVPATALNPEGPRLRDQRFAPISPAATVPSEGSAPTIVPTAPPDGDRGEPPDIGPAAIAALKERFLCQTLGQLSWPASWLSPTGVVLMCCNQAAQPSAPAPADGFRFGCLLPFDCSLLIDEGMGAISRLETITSLRQRMAPVRDGRTALALVDASVRDVVPLLGDRQEEVDFVRTGPWRYVAATLTGTRVVERPDGGYDVTTFVVPGCGCHHDLVEVQYYVDELAGVTEQSRNVVAEDLSGLCID
jgi:hypothetical protein